MKLRHILWAGTTAYATYQLLKNRMAIKEEVVETKNLTDRSKNQVTDIQTQLAKIKGQLPIIQDIAKDLAYKTKVFQGEIEARKKHMPLLQKENTDQIDQ